MDKHGTVIAGNKTLEAAVDIGLGDPVVVPSDGTRLVRARMVLLNNV